MNLYVSESNAIRDRPQLQSTQHFKGSCYFRASCFILPLSLLFANSKEGQEAKDK